MSKVKHLGFIDYSFLNYCPQCGITWGKQLHHCPKCKYPLRRTAGKKNRRTTREDVWRA